jgi:hypothetical protein
MQKTTAPCDATATVSWLVAYVGSSKRLSSLTTTMGDTPIGGTEPPVEHRGIEYTVLPTIPRGWKWSVRRNQNDRGGTCYYRDDAIQKAKLFIDNMLRRQALEDARDERSQT